VEAVEAVVAPVTGSLVAALRRRVTIWLLDRLIGQEASAYLSLSPGTYINHALCSEAFSARMFGDNPELPPEAKQAYRWAERQFNRIARGEVGERDLIG
jgi:hypothetical protein